MFPSLLVFQLFLLNFIAQSLSHVGEPCNKYIRVCLASNSYCDGQNICRCKAEYPVNISLHSCKKGKLYSQNCEYTEECVYYDPNSYCTQFPYRSTCECHSGFKYNEIKKICDKIGDRNNSGENSSRAFLATIGIALACTSVFCFGLVLWYLCKRFNLHRGVFPRPFSSSNSQHYVPTANSGSGMSPSAPLSSDDMLPNYDTALNLKEESEDFDPPPSYDEVISLEQETKT